MSETDFEIFGSWFNGHLDTTPKPFVLLWSEFVAEIVGRVEVRGEKFDGSGFNLARFKVIEGEVKRRNIYVDMLSGIVLDFDKDFDPETLFERLDGVAWLAYTTFSHGPDQAKWRIVVPTSTPIPGPQFRAVRAWLMQRLNPDGATKQKVDEQAKAPSNFFFGPGCPEHMLQYAEWRQSEGPRLELPPTTDFFKGTPAPRLLSTTIDWAWIKARMAMHKDPDVRRAFRAVLKGDSFADLGGRDTLATRMGGALAGWALQCDPDDLAAIFAQSIAKMSEEHPEDPPPDLSNIADKIARAQAAMLQQARQEREQDVQFTQEITMDDPAEPHELDAQARAVGLPSGDHLLRRLILRNEASSLWIWDMELGHWRGPMTDASAAMFARQRLGQVPGVQMWVRKVDGTLRMRTLPELAHEYGDMPRQIYGDLRAEKPRYDIETDSFILVGAPRRPLEPEYDALVDEWFRALGGSKPDKLLDWVAGLTWLNRPNSVLFIRGTPDVGKGLFVRGLSRVWNVDAPVNMKTLVETAHGGVALTRCPLVLIDEGKWDSRADVTTTLRNAVTEPSRNVNKKHHDFTELNGYLRFIVTANNFNIFANDRHSLTPEDRDAIAQRFLEINPSTRARDLLLSVPARERNDLAEQDRIARHALWLAANRPVESEGRFVVPGEGDSKFAVRIITDDRKWGSWVMEWLARYLSDPTVIEKQAGNLVHRDKGIVLVSPEAVINTFEIVLKNKQHPQSLEISNALRSLSLGDLQPLPGGNGSGFQVLVDDVADWAVEKGVGSSQKIRFNASVDRKPLHVVSSTSRARLENPS